MSASVEMLTSSKGRKFPISTKYITHLLEPSPSHSSNIYIPVQIVYIHKTVLTLCDLKFNGLAVQHVKFEDIHA